MSFEPVYWIGQGDTADPLLYTPQDVNGATVDLSAATEIRFRMRKPGSSTRKVDATAGASLVSPGANNQLRYDWAANDTDEAGVFGFYFLVTMPGGKTRRFRNAGYDYLQVQPS